MDDGRSPALDGAAALEAEVAAIEAAAMAVYALHGLPDQPGHYQRRERNAPWERLEDELTPAQRWALIETTPQAEGRRFASHVDLGADASEPEVRRASAVLAACRGLRQTLNDGAGFSAQDLADAIRLGAAWRRLEDEAAAPAARAAPQPD